MKENRRWVELRLAQNRRQMIQCPYQPGNLVLSKSACLHRNRGAKKTRDPVTPQDSRKPRYMYGPSLCGWCPLGGKPG